MSLTVVVAGGMCKAEGTLLTNTVKAVVHEAATRAVVVLPKVEPEVGTLLLALEATGVELDRRIQRSVTTTLPRELLIEGR